MEMTVQTQGFRLTSSIYRSSRGQFGRALSSFRDSIVDVDIYLKDLNGPKGGVDKAVLVRIALTTQQTIAIETVNENLHAALILSARRAKRAVKRTLAKHRRVDRVNLRNLRLSPG